MRYFGPSQTAFSCNFYKTKQHAQRVQPPYLLKKSWDGIKSWTWCCYSPFRFTFIYFMCIHVPSRLQWPVCPPVKMEDFVAMHLPLLAVSVPVGTQDPTASTEVCTCTPPGTSMQAAEPWIIHCYLLWSAVNCTPACQNGGTCRGNSSYAYCDCLSGYSGAYCEDRGRHQAQCQPPCRL